MTHSLFIETIAAYITITIITIRKFHIEIYIYIYILVKVEGLTGFIINIGFFQRHDWDKKCKFNNKPIEAQGSVSCVIHPLLLWKVRQS